MVRGSLADALTKKWLILSPYLLCVVTVKLAIKWAYLFDSYVPPCISGSTATTFETLLFSFGVALGVLFGAGPHQMEVKRLNQLLDETQANLEALKLEPGTRESPARTNDSEAVGRSQYETQQQHQMAELEAELEAELDQLTGRESAAMESQYSVLDEV